MASIAKTAKPSVKRLSRGRRAIETVKVLLEIFGQASVDNVPRKCLKPAQPGASGPVPWDALRDSWLGHGLKRCIEENRPDVVKMLLIVILRLTGPTD
jgi:hypothetical protein